VEWPRFSRRAHIEEFARLDLAQAEAFVEERPAEELGCLYYVPERSRFVQPAGNADLPSQGLLFHFGWLGGVLPAPRTSAWKGSCSDEASAEGGAALALQEGEGGLRHPFAGGPSASPLPPLGVPRRRDP
jgi:hypothetical protein